ncbi:NUDIX domain-containing protein [Streptomyces capillispiralis]|uniref:NUDIX domain-containing protein n=1 Tax=Streptomyces capillispiralis TaxID=68182 RepID=UPI0036A02345
MTLTVDTSRGFVVCAHGCRHWGPHGAAGLLLRHDGRVLLQQRAPHVHHGGTWSLPGGALHAGEKPRRGAHREASEELGGLPRIRHHATHTNDHGRWAYHTVIADTLEPFAPGRGDGEGTRTRWVAPGQVDGLRLHPDFADTWHHIATLIGGRR